MRLTRLFLAVAMLLPTSTFSQDVGPTTSFKNGTQLYEVCTASDNEKISFCIGYVMGVSDSLQSLHLTCSPKEATGRQVVDLVVDRLRDHPDVRQYVAAQEVTLALVKAFPCKK
jgi:Rap1a immunity proteins